MNFPKIDVVIPCYNAEKTIIRAVNSVLSQPQLNHLWLVDDGSTDNTLQLADLIAKQYPDKVTIEKLPRNVGVAKARNWGALQTTTEFVAFLDADDAYEPEALTVAASVFHFRPEVGVVRLALKPVDLAERYVSHPEFKRAWETMQMTCGGNMIFRRTFFFACGGFPQDLIFRDLGGEDGALGIATTRMSSVATLFDDVGVLHYCREGMHAQRLLDSLLFDKQNHGISKEKLTQADKVTERICEGIKALKLCLNTDRIGVKPLLIERSDEE
ncbi:glycosyltransferase [Pasteurella sp. PK-2025]|uniref:glycosyltransferase n=1 Tax=unclassified Pasteurella TaxID=2621516 RepID=UPI003C77528F